MTKEQEEAIKLAKEFTKMDFSNPMGWTGYYDTELKELSIAIETVLNILKEEDKEIEKLKRENEHWKNEFEKELEDNRKNTCELLKQDLIIRKKDRQIDLMAEYINKIDVSEEICEEKTMCNENCKDCIKQYFKSKAEKE